MSKSPTCYRARGMSGHILAGSSLKAFAARLYWITTKTAFPTPSMNALIHRLERWAKLLYRASARIDHRSNRCIRAFIDGVGNAVLVVIQYNLAANALRLLPAKICPDIPRAR